MADTTDTGADAARADKERGLQRLLHDRRTRALVIQAAVFLLIASGLAFAALNTASNLHKAGIASGFGFLGQTAGFDISQTLVEYSRASTYARAFLVGLLNTLVVSVVAIAASTVLGFFLGVARLSPNWIVSHMAAVWIDIVRNVPLLLQVFFWYIAILNPLPGPRQALSLGDALFLCNRGVIMPGPVWGQGSWAVGAAFVLALGGVFWLRRYARRRHKATGRRLPVFSLSLGLLVLLPLAAMALAGFPVGLDMPAMSGFNFKGGMTIIPEFIALCLSLSLYASAFIAENVRAGIMAVRKGQREAALALGLRPGLTMRLVVIPQAMRIIIPPLTSQHLTTVKNSSLAVVIGYPDLISVFAGTTLNQTGQAVEVIALTMLVYLAVSLAISLAMNWYDAKMAITER
ncbi:amino acid ABC transporter permease [Desulfocurvus sp. DL9XJH121]